MWYERRDICFIQLASDAPAEFAQVSSVYKLMGSSTCSLKEIIITAIGLRAVTRFELFGPSCISEVERFAMGNVMFGVPYVDCRSGNHNEVSLHDYLLSIAANPQKGVESVLRGLNTTDFQLIHKMISTSMDDFETYWKTEKERRVLVSSGSTGNLNDGAPLLPDNVNFAHRRLPTPMSR